MNEMLNLRLFISLIFITLAFLVFVINLIKKEKLELKYALLWIITSVALITIVLFPYIPYTISQLLGIGLVVNTIFFLGILMLITIVFGLTVALSRASRRITVLTQDLALLKNKVEDNCLGKDERACRTDRN